MDHILNFLHISLPVNFHTGLVKVTNMKVDWLLKILKCCNNFYINGLFNVCIFSVSLTEHENSRS